MKSLKYGDNIKLILTNKTRNTNKRKLHAQYDVA